MERQPPPPGSKESYEEILTKFYTLVSGLQEEVKELKAESYRNRQMRSEFDDETSDVSRGNQYRTPKIDSNLGSIKMTIPSFYGKQDPEVFFEWSNKIESIFAVHNYSEEKKVKLAVVEFAGYARSWWTKIQAERRRDEEGPVRTWDELKRLMTKRFVPHQYYREMFNKLQKITQGNRTVEDYYQELEIAMLRVNIQEDSEASMARFLGGLTRDIAHIVEMQEYEDLNEMYHKALKAERQLKERGKRTFSTPQNSNTLKTTWPKKDLNTDFKKAATSSASKTTPTMASSTQHPSQM